MQSHTLHTITVFKVMDWSMCQEVIIHIQILLITTLEVQHYNTMIVSGKIVGDEI